MVRLDKWLWASRFYKTRSLASDAIKNGRVRVNEVRVKASRTVNLHDIVAINKGQGHEVIVEVLGLSDNRGNYTTASKLYTETPESLLKAEKRRAAQKSGLIDIQSDSMRKPDKKQRRELLAIRKGDFQK